MNAPTGNHQEGNERSIELDQGESKGVIEGNEAAPIGVNMTSLCRTLARVLALLEESEYTDRNQQDTVHQHAALPDLTSVNPTREAS